MYFSHPLSCFFLWTWMRWGAWTVQFFLYILIWIWFWSYKMYKRIPLWWSHQEIWNKTPVLGGISCWDSDNYYFDAHNSIRNSKRKIIGVSVYMNISTFTWRYILKDVSEFSSKKILAQQLLKSVGTWIQESILPWESTRCSPAHVVHMLGSVSGSEDRSTHSHAHVRKLPSFYLLLLIFLQDLIQKNEILFFCFFEELMLLSMIIEGFLLEIISLSRVSSSCVREGLAWGKVIWWKYQECYKWRNSERLSIQALPILKCFCEGGWRKNGDASEPCRR